MNNPCFGLNRQNLIDILEKHAMTSGGLAIASDKKEVKTATDMYYFIGGKLYVLVAGDLDDPTTGDTLIDGTVHNSGTKLDQINVFVFSVDRDGVVSCKMGTEASALEDVVFPATPADEAVIGFIIVDLVTNAGTGDFVGGTHELDDATVDPNVIYIDAVAPMRFA